MAFFNCFNVLEDIFSLFFITNTLVSANIEDCLSDWGKILSNVIDNHHDSSTKMLYYTGKNLNDLGRYHACTEIPEAKYALLEFYKPPWFTIALCGPKSCSKPDYHEIIYSNTNIVNIYLSSVIPDFPNNNTNVYFPSEEQANLDIDTGRAIMIVVVILLIVIGLIATTISLSYANKNKNKSIKGYKYLACFSLYDNLKDLSAKKNEERIGSFKFDILDGIRVMCVG